MEVEYNICKQKEKGKVRKQYKNLYNLNGLSPEVSGIQIIIQYPMMQVLPPQRKASTKQFDTLSETSTESGQLLDSLDRNDFSLRARNAQSSNNKAKSSLCRNFMEKGSCPYGSKCQFAHGTLELKCNSDNHMSYKTRPCHAFARKGFCTYGQRCNFLHIDDGAQPVQDIKNGYKEVIYSGRNGGSKLFSILGSQ